MEIYFAMKEEINTRRQEEFLTLMPGDRLEAYLKIIGKQTIFGIPDDYKHPNDEKNNFVIFKKDGTQR